MTIEQQRKAEQLYERLMDIQHRMEWIAQDPEANITELPKVVEDFEKFYDDHIKLLAQLTAKG